MKVAVVFIGTDKYLNFLPTWYERCEEFFLPGVDKKYLIFTVIHEANLIIIELP